MANTKTATRNVWGDDVDLLLDREPQEAKPGHITRRNQNDLTDGEKTSFRNALTRLIDTGFFGALVAIHEDMTHRMHGSFTSSFVGFERFLPWHRAYLSRFGEALRGIDENLFVPYWQWTVDREIPEWLDDFMPQGIPMPGGNRLDVERRVGVGEPEPPTLTSMQDIMAVDNWHEFVRRLEGVPFGAHNQVHVFIGGTMGSMLSPADPLFWLHHCEIDRRWAAWQQGHEGEGPRVTGNDAILDPWPETVEDVLDMGALNYEYDTLELG